MQTKCTGSNTSTFDFANREGVERWVIYCLLLKVLLGLTGALVHWVSFFFFHNVVLRPDYPAKGFIDLGKLNTQTGTGWYQLVEFVNEWAHLGATAYEWRKVTHWFFGVKHNDNLVLYNAKWHLNQLCILMLQLGRQPKFCWMEKQYVGL